MHLKLLEEKKLDISNLVLWVQLFRVHPPAHFSSTSRQPRSKREIRSESLLHNCISLHNLTWFQITLKEEIHLDKEQALALGI